MQEANLRQELAETNQTISLSIKLQTLKEADLSDLQKRYQNSFTAQEQQHQLLLNQLSEKLILAADYFHNLSDQERIAQQEKLKIRNSRPLWLSFFKKK